MKLLVKRLKQDPFFHFDCGFLLSDDVPSESSYSRMISAISETDALAKIQDVLVAQAIQEGYITEESLAIDATHFEARDKPTAAGKKEKPVPKNEDGSRKTGKLNGKQPNKNRKKKRSSMKKRLSINWMPPPRCW